MPSCSTVESLPTVVPPVQRRSTLKIILLALIALVPTELVCRFGIGLGDPPLYQADGQIEYLLQPSKTYHRFHNRISVNRYGMRADEFPPLKSSANEFRVIVVGDSIVYAGVRLDQNEIATEILKRDLEHDFVRPVVVGNASAKSWGPPNELEYLKRYGTLDADVVILELSSHDYADAPTFVPVVGISSDYRDKKPLLALADLFGTYFFPRYLHIGTTPASVEKTRLEASPSEQDIAECREAESEFFRFARMQKAKVALVQHLSLQELTGTFHRGYYANQEVAREESVPYVDDAGELQSQLKSGGSPFYSGDSLHLSRSGQPILAHTLRRAVDLALKSQ